MNRKFLTQLAILALVWATPANPQAQSPTGIVRGIVVRDGTSEPIRDAEISLGRSQATTDKDGRFTIEGLLPGQYRVIAQREGYFAPDASNPGSLLAQTTATITAQQTTEVKLTLVPGGTVSGRVVGPDGRPFPDALVEIIRVVYQGTGRALQTISRKPSDDRGEYRLFDLPPDNYLVAASPRSAASPIGITGGVPPRELLVRTFYPNVFESSNAAPIAIRPGDNVERINIQLRTATGSRIEGRVISQLPTPASVPAIAAEYIERQSNRSLLTIVPHNRNEFFDPRFSSTPAVSMVAPNNGAFQLGNVPPGVYDLYAPLPDPTGYGPEAAPGKSAQPVSIGRATVEVQKAVGAVVQICLPAASGGRALVGFAGWQASISSQAPMARWNFTRDFPTARAYRKVDGFGACAAL